MKKSTVGEILKNAETLFATDYCGEYFWSDVDDFFEILSESAENETPLGMSVFFLEPLDDKNYIVVDGIKRLIGSSLFLYALCECYKRTSAKNEDARQKILSRYLLNGTIPKIKLQGADAEIYEKIIFSKKLTPEEKENQLFLVLHRFWELIKQNNIAATKLFKSFSNIEAIIFYTNSKIANNRDIYSIFNSNNGSNQLDLIDSYLQENCPKNSSDWLDIVATFVDENITQCFLTDFISINFSGRYRCDVELYKYFKIYYEKMTKYRTPKEIFKDIKKYANYYLKIICADFEDFDIKKQLVEVNENHGQDAYAYLMEVLDDYESGHLEREMFLEILKTVAKFVSEREQTGADIDFHALSGELNKMLTIEGYSPLGAFEKLTINQMMGIK